MARTPVVSADLRDSEGDADGFERWARRFDIMLACAGLVALSPLLLVLGLLLRLESRGSIVAGRSRLGRDGSVFQSFQFRTARGGRTRPDTATRGWLAVEPQAHEPRHLSSLGHYLQDAGLDQLPELLNVLRGEMSLVGPRPIDMPDISHAEAARFLRYQLRPGMTGLWRIRRLSDPTDRELAQLDELYAKRRSLRLYLRVLAETLPAVLTRRGWY